MSLQTSEDNCRVFNPADLSLYIEKFPVLQDKTEIGQGCYSAVFDNNGTVLKLTCDTVYKDFLCAHTGTPGVPKLIKYHGEAVVENELVYLLEVEKLSRLDKWDHEAMMLESEALSRALNYRIAAYELAENPTLGNAAFAKAIGDVIASRMFSTPVMWALSAISKFVTNYGTDTVLDLHPSNFMTNGKNLVISDPLIPVH